MDRSRWAIVVGAAFCFFVFAIAWLGFSGGEYNFCGDFGYYWATVDLVVVLALSFLPFAIGWLWVSKGRRESSAHHADRFNDFMTILFAAAMLCMLWVAQLTITPAQTTFPGIYGYVIHKQGDLRIFLIENCATLLAVLLVGF